MRKTAIAAFARAGLIVAIAAVAAGCTFGEVKPQLAAAPPPVRATTLVVRELKFSDPTWDVHRRAFVKGVTEWAQKNGGLTVVSEASAPTPPDSIVLVGTLTEVDKGSAAARLFVGMGAGQAKARGDFEIQDPTGAPLAKFTARRSYLGGAGIGGAGFIDMDDLVARLGETVAETTHKWLRGEKID